MARHDTASEEDGTDRFDSPRSTSSDKHAARRGSRRATAAAAAATTRNSTLHNPAREWLRAKLKALPRWVVILSIILLAMLLAAVIYLAVAFGSKSANAAPASPPASPSASPSPPPPGQGQHTVPGSSSSPHRYLFTFGASYTANGFDLSGHWPNDQNPIGNPAYPGISESKGAMWPDYLATTYNSSLTYLFDMAVSGAVTDTSITGPSSVRSFTQQVNELWLPTLASRPEGAHWDPATTAFGVFVGLNDILVYYKNATIDIPSQAKTILTSYFHNLETLHQTGARKFFTFNINPGEKTPMILRDPKADNERYGTWVAAYNKEMQTQADAFAKKHTDSAIHVFDNHAIWENVLQDPHRYCFKDATSIGDGGCPYLWANDFHPGYQMQKVITEQLSRDLKTAGIY